jgi:hypothetical protein
MASGREGLGSGCEAIQLSRAARSGGSMRTSTPCPRPVVFGRPRLDFGISRIAFFILSGYHKFKCAESVREGFQPISAPSAALEKISRADAACK